MSEGRIFEFRVTLGFEPTPNTRVAECLKCGRQYVRHDMEDFDPCECGSTQMRYGRFGRWQEAKDAQ